jgi:WhiB family transcriptional regulator, redox-sensing transcriptional regulator
MAESGDWNMLGNCRTGDPDRFFVTGARQRAARSVCRGCPVVKQCLAKALDERIEYGIWGGLTERERRSVLRARPDVSCWASFLDQIEARRCAPAAAPLAPVLPLAATQPTHGDPDARQPAPTRLPEAA